VGVRTSASASGYLTARTRPRLDCRSGHTDGYPDRRSSAFNQSHRRSQLVFAETRGHALGQTPTVRDQWIVECEHRSGLNIRQGRNPDLAGGTMDKCLMTWQARSRQGRAWSRFAEFVEQVAFGADCCDPGPGAAILECYSVRTQELEGVHRAFLLVEDAG